MNTEADEEDFGIDTTSYVFDVSSLTAPVALGNWKSPYKNIDHNMYFFDDLIYKV